MLFYHHELFLIHSRRLSLILIGHSAKEKKNADNCDDDHFVIFFTHNTLHTHTHPHTHLKITAVYFYFYFNLILSYKQLHIQNTNTEAESSERGRETNTYIFLEPMEGGGVVVGGGMW